MCIKCKLTCAYLCQAVTKRHVQRTLVVASVVHCLACAVLVDVVASRKFGRNDHEVAVLLLLHPFTDPLLRFTVLVVLEQHMSVFIGRNDLIVAETYIRSIDEVAACCFECVEQLE